MKKRLFTKNFLIGLLLICAMASAAFWLDWWIYENNLNPTSLARYFYPPVQRIENTISDVIISAAAGKEPDKRISIAAIDDNTVQKYGWPFSRKYHAALVDKLNALGAKTIVFDVMFLEPGVKPDEDAMLVAATKKNANVIHTGLVDSAITSAGTVFSMRQPFGDLGKAACLIASPNVEGMIDPDGHIRRAMIFYNRAFYHKDCGTCCLDCDGMPVASLSAAAYSHFTNTPLDKVYSQYRERNILRINFTMPDKRVKNPGRKGKSNEEYILSSYPHISVLDILEDSLSDGEKAAVKDGIIIIGSTSMGTFDHYPTPFFTAPGAEFHAAILDDMLNNSFLKTAPPVVMFAIIILFILLPIFTLGGAPLINIAIAGGALILWAIIYSGLLIGGTITGFVLPSAGFILSFIFVTAHRFASERKEKRWIKNTLGQYLSPKVVDALVKEPSKLKLGGEKRDMSVCFIDMAGFSAISEKMEPEKLTRFLNVYLSAMTDAILKYDGVVDKYIGDCVMAFWNAPLDLKEHRLMGCLSALECLKAMEDVNRKLGLKPNAEKMAVRIGINSGGMIVGNMGSATRFSYTVIGDQVNLASRLESANKFFGSKIIASEAVYVGAKDKVAAKNLGRIRVAGRSMPINVYELVGKKSEIPPQKQLSLDAYAEGLDYFHKRNFEKAANCFENVLSAFADDGPAKLYLGLSREYAVNPPHDNWEGIFNLTEK